MIEKNIIYEDEALIVCRKPAGTATQTPVVGQQDMVSMLKNYRAKRKEEPYIGLVHRLDQPVEGIMVFAKTKEAAADLSKQVAERDFVKEYYAVTEGEFTQTEGTLVNWLLRDGKTNTSQVVQENTPKAKKACLDYKVLEVQTDSNKYKESLIQVFLHTGRHHQIRVQLAAAGHPIVGDRKYGKREQKAYEPLSLCSCRINFIHPVTKKRMDFKIEPTGTRFRGFAYWEQ